MSKTFLVKIVWAGLLVLSLAPPAMAVVGPFRPLIDTAREDRQYVRVLDIGDEALLARVHLIRCAEKSIYIQTFIWTNDETGRYVAHELIEAAKRGVDVKIIVDLWKSPRVSELVAYISGAHANIKVKTYNPTAKRVSPSKLRMVPEIALKFKKVNQRMHNKTFIVDDAVAITGGRNYENDYYDRGVRRNFKDRDVLVVGPVAARMASSFQEYWDFDLSMESKDLVDVAPLMREDVLARFAKEKSLQFGGLFADTDIQASNHGYIQKVLIDPIFSVEKIRFIADKPGKNNSGWLKGGGVATEELAKILFEAKRSIVAQTPYLVLDGLTINGVKKLRRKNPAVDILISSNSLASTDNIYAYSFAFKQKKIFVKDLRFRIFEFRPVPEDIALMMPRYAGGLNGNGARADEEAVDSLSQEKGMNSMASDRQHLCIHAKSFVIDDEIAWIGSFNLDPRSVHLNTEVGLIIWDPEVAQAVKANIAQDMAPQNSWTIGKVKDVPVVSFFSDFLGGLVQKVPIVDVWPFQYTTSFKLNDGREAVPFYDPRFYGHYSSVGPFPEVGLSLREIQIRLLKAFTGVALPII